MQAWMCEKQHPERPEVSRFFTESAAVADEYRRLGWTVTSLGSHEPRLRAVLHQVMTALARSRPTDTPDGWREYEDAMNAARAALHDAAAGVPGTLAPCPGIDDRAAEWDAWHEEFKRTHGYGPGIGDAWDAAYRAAWKRATAGVNPSGEKQ